MPSNLGFCKISGELQSQKVWKKKKINMGGKTALSFDVYSRISLPAQPHTGQLPFYHVPDILFQELGWWRSRSNCCLQLWHHISEHRFKSWLCCFLLIYLAKAADDKHPSVRAPAGHSSSHLWETLMESLAPVCWPGQPWLLQPFGGVNQCMKESLVLTPFCPLPCLLG